MFRDFPTFSRICIFFLLPLSLLWSSLLSASALLCFSSAHIVGSLTSKLPSIIRYYNTYMNVEGERAIYIYIYTHYSIYFYKKVRKTQIMGFLELVYGSLASLRRLVSCISQGIHHISHFFQHVMWRQTNIDVENG